jgi:hypothetical protein
MQKSKMPLFHTLHPEADLSIHNHSKPSASILCLVFPKLCTDFSTHLSPIYTQQEDESGGKLLSPSRSAGRARPRVRLDFIVAVSSAIMTPSPTRMHLTMQTPSSMRIQAWMALIDI